MRRLRIAASLALALLSGALAYGIHDALLGRTVTLPWATPTVTLMRPERLSLLAAIPLGLWAARFSLANLGPFRRRLSMAVRTGLFALLALALSQPTRATKRDEVALVYAIDVSDSISEAAFATARAHLNETLAQAEAPDQVQVVTFAGDAHRPAAGAAPLARPRDRAGDASDPTRALQLAYALLPPERVRRVLLVTDGLQTRGDLLAEAERARALGVQIDVLPLRAPPPAEIAITGVVLPDAVEVGESFEVRVQLHATRAESATLRLYQDDVLNGRDGVRTIELTPGNNEVSFRSLVRIAGPVRYRAEVAPDGADRFAQNNRASAKVWATGRPRVLLVDPAPQRVAQVARALGAADYDVEVRTATALPRSVAELAGFDFVIASNVPADSIGGGQTRAIERYLRDLGGGFMMAGGDQGFALGGYAGTAMERLLPVSMESQRHHDEHSLALCLVIDTSGSMAGPKMGLAKEAAKAAANLLSDGDLIEVIGFSSTPSRIVRLQAASNRTRVARDIGRLIAQGGTAIFPALDAAYQDLSLARARVKHVILLTDGQTQESGIPELAQTMRAEGMTVSTVGLGTDVNRSLLQRAANLGDGRAYFTDDPDHVPRIFMRETSTVARSNAIEEQVRARVQQPADFLAGIALSAAPALRGYVSTRKKPPPAQVILATETGEPLLARMRVGLGWSLAWTSDLHPRWANAWLRWRQLSPFLGQLVREHMRKPSHDQLPLSLEVERGTLLARVDAIGPNDRFINDFASSLRVVGPEGGNADQAPLNLERDLRLVAPGRYETRLPLNKYGAFSVEAVHRRDGRVVARSHGQLLHPYPEEYARTEADLALLSAVARAAGGRVAPSPAEALAPRGRSVPGQRPLWPLLAGLSLALFVADVGVRRTGSVAGERGSKR